MDRRVIRVLTAGALTMFAITACCAQQVLYVDAQRGSDLHDGTQAKPFASLARARVTLCAPPKKANAFPERGVVIEVSGNFSLAKTWCWKRKSERYRT